MRLESEGSAHAYSSDSDDKERHILDAALGHSLSQLSSSAKFAASLNQISHVVIREAYNREEHGALVAVYVVDVFLTGVQKGLPTTSAQSWRKLTWRQKREKQSERPQYQVEHRYSSFRLLRQRILDVVSATPTDMDQNHPQCCPYCSRVLWLVTAGDFPSRYPHGGALATYTGWRQLLVHSRKHGLEKFINELLTAAKDVSYRYSAIQCERYATVSGVLNDFLGDPHLRTAFPVRPFICVGFNTSKMDSHLQIRGGPRTLHCSFIMISLRLPSKRDAVVDSESRDNSLGVLSPGTSPFRRLSQLSTTAKSAMSLNEIYRVQISSTYESDDATIYVVNVFLRTTQKGLPTVETLDQRRRRLCREYQGQTPDYQVEHRYSDFRAMVKSISDVVNDHDHFRFCAYCSRVGTTESAAGFPPRVPNRGPLAAGWRQLLTRVRKHRLERFMNQMLKASKDMSYRTSATNQCGRFLVVSQIMNSFLAPREGAKVSAVVIEARQAEFTTV
ncbi:hypothetical protein JG688_00006763 [Phytophthora aleatoria]|uniref:PX domain-containing protein n=1 Tax=Phytophthora aleatoria TaxID=2496075 RepID=A0A8J5IKT9_9STRA|nr:hypothetical protein JG688_00006763 [Phytophthora aleatoria]